MFCCVYVFSFPAGVYVGTLNLIASIPDPSILTIHVYREQKTKQGVLYICLNTAYQHKYLISMLTALKGSQFYFYLRPSQQLRSCWDVVSIFGHLYSK